MCNCSKKRQELNQSDNALAITNSAAASAGTRQSLPMPAISQHYTDRVTQPAQSGVNKVITGFKKYF
jgi:hypothetical protein